MLKNRIAIVCFWSHENDNLFGHNFSFRMYCYLVSVFPLYMMR